MWERADIILGGMEAQYGNKTALLVDITSKSGTRPGFGSAQIFGGSNETVNPSFEYGGTIGEKVRFYVLNTYTTTNRGIEPPTLGHSVFHDQHERNQTYLRGDYQHDNRNSFSWVFLSAVAKYQIPTSSGLEVNGDTLPLLQAQDPTFSPVASQAVNQNQKENSQYTHLVWRHDLVLVACLALLNAGGEHLFGLEVRNRDAGAADFAPQHHRAMSHHTDENPGWLRVIEVRIGRRLALSRYGRGGQRKNECEKR